MAFRARKAFGTFEKRAPGFNVEAEWESKKDSLLAIMQHCDQRKTRQ